MCCYISSSSKQSHLGGFFCARMLDLCEINQVVSMKKILLVAVVVGLVGCGKSQKEKEMEEMEAQVTQSMTKEIREGKTWDYYSTTNSSGLTIQTWALIDEGAVYKSPYARLIVQKLSSGIDKVSIIAEHTEFGCKQEYCSFVAKFDGTEQTYTFDASTSSPNRQVILKLLDSEVPQFIDMLKKSKKLTVSGGFFMVEMPSATFNTDGLSKLKVSP